MYHRIYHNDRVYKSETEIPTHVKNIPLDNNKRLSSNTPNSLRM